MDFISFEPNKPQELALSGNPGPFKLPGGCGCLFSLSDGRLLHLDARTAESLAVLKLGPGETFRVCLQGQPGGISYWSVWLSPETEKARAAAEAPELERQLAASIEIAQSRRPELRPTGTEGGPVALPLRKPAIAAIAGGRKRSHGEPIPLNIAFREITAFVVATLNESGEQWSENSRQDLVSTILIAAQKANLLTVWERDAA